LRTGTRFGERCDVGSSNFSLNVSVGPDFKIGDYSFIDQSTVLGHDVTVGSFCHIGVNVFMAGESKVGDGAVINSGAMIGRQVNIGAGAEIGMGSVVLRDVPPNTLVMGNPARAIRNVGGSESA
jgi:acetyltransferase-like isoleucine patch superfamily enzyme